MKKKIIILSALCVGLIAGQHTYAQGTAQNDDLFVSHLSTDSTVYSGYDQSGVITAAISHASQTVTIDSGAVEVSLLLPNGLELDTASMTVPSGWGFVYENSGSCKFYNTGTLAPFPLWTEQEFHIPFDIVGPINNQEITLDVYFQGLIGLGYLDTDNANNTSSIGVNVADVSLPVDFASFNARVVGCDVALTWETRSEENNDYFIIERSQDGRYFEQIGTVKSLVFSDVNGAEYSFMDEQPLKGDNFYRIRQVDINGKSTATSIEKAQVSCDIDGDIAVYPNPTRGIVYVKGLAAAQTIEVFNILGQRVISQKVKEGTEIVDISNLADGNYTINVISNRESIFSAKVVKK